VGEELLSMVKNEGVLRNVSGMSDVVMGEPNQNQM
jgi:hypothetical protein